MRNNVNRDKIEKLGFIGPFRWAFSTPNHHFSLLVCDFDAPSQQGRGEATIPVHTVMVAKETCHHVGPVSNKVATREPSTDHYSLAQSKQWRHRPLLDLLVVFLVMDCTTGERISPVGSGR